MSETDYSYINNFLKCFFNQPRGKTKETPWRQACGYSRVDMQICDFYEFLITTENGVDLFTSRKQYARIRNAGLFVQ